MKGEKRPRLPKREVQDMARTKKVQTARRMEMFSSAVRPARSSVMFAMYLLTVSCKLFAESAGAGEEEGGAEKICSIALLACATAPLRLVVGEIRLLRLLRPVYRDSKMLEDATVARYCCLKRYRCSA